MVFSLLFSIAITITAIVAFVFLPALSKDI